MPDSTAEDVLMDLHGRLRRAALSLSDLASGEGILRRSDAELGRLAGKREGVLLALSYIEDEVRTRGLVLR